MKNVTAQKVVYSVISFLAIAIVIAADLSLKNTKVNYQTPVLSVALYISVLVVGPIFIFFKTVLQLKLPVGFSRIINILSIVFLIAGAAAFNRFPVLLFVFASYPGYTFLFCFYLCSLIYDFFPVRAKAALAPDDGQEASD